MIFHAGYCHPNTQDIARLSESIKNMSHYDSIFSLFKSRATSHVFGQQYLAWKSYLARYHFTGYRI